MRRFVTLLMILLLVLSPMAALASSGDIRLVVNGTEVTTDVPPVLEGNHTLVPIRALSEALGFAVSWDEAAQTVTITGDTVIILGVGRSEALVDGEPSSLDVPPVIRNGRTLVPVRFVAESMGLDVAWDADSLTVSVSQAAEPAEAEPEPVESKPAESEPAESEPAESEPAESEPAESEPAESEPAESEPAESEPAAVAPEIQAIWDKINASRDGHVTGTFVTETALQAGMPAVSTHGTIESWTLGEDSLTLVTIDAPLIGEMTMGFAAYQGQMWALNPQQGWIRVEGLEGLFDFEVSGVTQDYPSLEKAQVDLAQAELDGIPMTRLTVTWQSEDLVEVTGVSLALMLEGSMTATFWLDAEGVVRQVDNVTVYGVEGQEIVSRATLKWEPLEGTIPFPPEILGEN